MQWKYLQLFSGIAACALLALQPAWTKPRELPWRGDAPVVISVVVEGRVSLPDQLTRAMERELTRAFAPSDTRVELVLPHERTEHPVFDSEVIVMRVSGRCELGPMPPLNSHKPDTLGRTFVTDGQILPFVELDCKQISGALRAKLSGTPAEYRPQVLGRAMGRVLAHEIYHVLSRSSDHSPHGLAAETMNPEQMTCDRLDFRFEDFERMGLLPAMGTY